MRHGRGMHEKKNRLQTHWTKVLSRRSESSVPVSNSPSYSMRVCAKCALKIWNDVELPCFLKATLNPVIADVEATVR